MRIWNSCSFCKSTLLLSLNYIVQIVLQRKELVMSELSGTHSLRTLRDSLPVSAVCTPVYYCALVTEGESTGKLNVNEPHSKKKQEI